MISRKFTTIMTGMALACGASLSINALAASVPQQISEHSQIISMTHQTVEISTNYDRFIASLDKLAGHYDDKAAEEVLSNPALAKKAYESMQGDQGLVLFNAMPHGNLLNLSLGKPRKAMLMHIGNALIASQLMAKDIRSGLYVPLSVYVWEVKPGLVRVEYDLPSSQLGQFGVPDVSKTAKALNEKLSTLIKDATVAAS